MKESTCKHCGKPIMFVAFEHHPSEWFHTETEWTTCFKGIPVATPDD